ncbi:MAG: DUF721 domain-containing protein [Bacteroidales bacterium]|nr:DUF721 domain-containing protein [Bacteroidales bacterium]
MSRMQRKTARPALDFVREWLQENSLGEGLNTQIIYNAWDEVSNASQRTVRRYFHDGILYVTLNSSVARAALFSRSRELVRELNAKVRENVLFTGDGNPDGPVKELRLK